MSEILKFEPGKPSPFAFISVPGIGNSGPEHWQTWMEGVIGDVQRIPVSDWRNPDLNNWLNAIEASLMTEWRPAILIAHSFGALAAAQYAIEEPTRVAGVLLVAPADPARFADGARLSLSRLPCSGLLVASRNDPWMELRVAQRWAHIWGATLMDEGEAGHINVDSGHGRWPKGLTYLARLAYEARAKPSHRRDGIYLNGQEARLRGSSAS